MLKNRSLIVLAVVLVVLVAISLIQSIRHKQITSRPSTTPLLTGTFTSDDLQRIEIGYGPDQEVVVMDKLPDGWVLRTAFDHQVNQSRIDNLLQNLSDLKGEFRSDEPAVLADYGFTDSTVVLITGYTSVGSAPAFSLLIGNKPQGSMGNFVKLPGDDAVYLTSKNVLSALGLYGGPAEPQNKHFFDLEAHMCDRFAVDAINLYDGDTFIAMEKQFSEPEADPAGTTGTIPEIDRKVYEWVLTEPQAKAALKTKADGVLGAISTVRAADVADPEVDPADYGLVTPQKRVEIIMEDGSMVSIVFGEEIEASEGQPAGAYMRVGDDRTVWIANEYLLKNIFKSFEDLLPQEK